MLIRSEKTVNELIGFNNDVSKLLAEIKN